MAKSINEPVYNRIPQIQTRKANIPNCPMCSHRLKQAHFYVFTYNTDTEKKQIHTVLLLYCENCDLPFSTNQYIYQRMH